LVASATARDLVAELLELLGNAARSLSSSSGIAARSRSSSWVSTSWTDQAVAPGRAIRSSSRSPPDHTLSSSCSVSERSRSTPSGIVARMRQLLGRGLPQALDRFGHLSTQRL
jgi:hypothetical protein